MKVTIVGLGLIGGSLGLDLRARGFASQVMGVDVSIANAKRALELKLVDGVIALDEALKRSDLVILAVPVCVVLELLPEVLSGISKTATVTDMGSTKGTICAAAGAHPNRAQFVASHPMAGTENSGPDAALQGLFDSKTAVICDRDASGPAHLARVEAMYRALRMRVLHMTSGEHDLHTAYVSHLSHISSFVLANTVLAKEKNVNTIFDLAGGGFESTVRLAKSSPDMWSPIFEQNSANVVAALESYIAHLQQFQKAMMAGDAAKTRELMENANQIRRVLTSLGTREQSSQEGKK